MGTHAERVALSEHVSRADQDAFSLESHRRAVAAIDAGRFEAELAPVPIADWRTGDELLVAADEGPRRDTSLEALARLRPAFDLPAVDEGLDASAAIGSVTAGNAPGITDGAAATVVASARAVERYRLRPLARIVGYAQAEMAPRWIFLAPIEGVKRLEERTGIAPSGFDLVEINEAFAAQTLADGRALGLDWERVNVNGGAIALGHPIGASGARIYDARPRAAAAGGSLRPRDALPGRRRLGSDGDRAGGLRPAFGGRPRPWRALAPARGGRSGQASARVARGRSRTPLGAATWPDVSPCSVWPVPRVESGDDWAKRQPVQREDAPSRRVGRRLGQTSARVARGQAWTAMKLRDRVTCQLREHLTMPEASRKPSRCPVAGVSRTRVTTVDI